MARRRIDNITYEVGTYYNNHTFLWKIWTHINDFNMSLNNFQHLLLMMHTLVRTVPPRQNQIRIGILFSDVNCENAHLAYIDGSAAGLGHTGHMPAASISLRY